MNETITMGEGLGTLRIARAVEQEDGNARIAIHIVIGIN